MSPNDILVSWYTIGQAWYYSDRFELHFGPQARLVRNIMVRPWVEALPYRKYHTVQAFHLAARFIQKLGNYRSLETIFALEHYGSGSLRYAGCASSEEPESFGPTKNRPTWIFDAMNLRSKVLFRSLMAQHRFPKYLFVQPSTINV
ncbi:hypothetical protein F5Y19DRAFT_411891, partial [Xylariaceae sp. FL1651]